MKAKCNDCHFLCDTAGMARLLTKERDLRLCIPCYEAREPIWEQETQPVESTTPPASRVVWPEITVSKEDP